MIDFMKIYQNNHLGKNTRIMMFEVQEIFPDLTRKNRDSFWAYKSGCTYSKQLMHGDS